MEGKANAQQGRVKYLRWTRWDEAVDEASANPGRQHFEKMVAGMYIGDICLRIYQELHPEEVLRRWDVEEDGFKDMFRY